MSRAPLTHVPGCVLVLGLALAAPLGAQALKSSFDRSVIPPAGPTPALHVPAWTTTTLSNGARLIVSQRRNLPLVSFSITWVGGAFQYMPPDKTGLAMFTAAMLSEGTTHRTGDQLSSDLQLLGTNVSTSISGEDGEMRFTSMKDKLAPTLAILEDMLVNPTFPADALERLRARTLVQLTQAKDRTGAIAGRVFPKVLYGEAHPYGRSMTEASVKAITREDIVAFHKAYFTPGHAVITVVGDVDPAAVQATIEQALAPWSAGGAMPEFSYPTVPAPRATTVYLVDKPGAAQSSFAIGLPGPPRSTPDYMALQVLNTILGDQFQSRLNADIRERKGYSYGVGSSFAFGKGPGAFRAGGDIVSAKTDSALIEFMTQLKGVRGSMPITDEELQTAKDLLVQGLPEAFSSVSAVNGAITELYTEGLPQDYYQNFAGQVKAITKADLQRVADRYIDTDHLAIVIVGDRKSIEGPLKALNYGPVVVLDTEGNPVTP